MRTLLPLVFLLLLCTHVKAETDPQPILAKVNMNQMNRTANKVLNDLKMAKGILASEPPFIKVRRFTGSLKLAIYYRERNEIHLDSLSYEIMRAMGQDSLNALAFMLGHELGHYINKHKKINHAIKEAAPELMQTARVRNLSDEINKVNANTDFNKKLESAIVDYSDTHDEAEADFEGGFLGYLAGYKPMEAGKEFLRRAYDHPFMNLTKKTPGYPSYDERLEIINKTTSELQELIPVFEMANYLVALEQYQDAVPYFEKIIRKFQSRELYNNIGVSMMLEILRLFQEPITDYKFPLTLDASFRVPHPDFTDQDMVADLMITPGWMVHTQCQLNNIQHRILVAEDYFEKALALDKEYAPAYLNLSIAQSIKAILFKFNSVNGTVNCSELKHEELEKAIASIVRAKQITERSLAGYLVNTFSKNDTISPFPDIMEPDDGSVVKEAYKAQRFGHEILIRELSEPDLTPDSTSWFKSIESSFNYESCAMPDKAQLLSNIYVQTDIVHILMGKLKDKKIPKQNPHSFGLIEVTPFNRALEINPNNEIARYNKVKALNLEEPGVAFATDKLCDITIELFDSKTILEIAKAQSEWPYDEVIEVSKLNFNNLDKWSFLSDNQHRLQFAKNERYNLYANTTTEDLDNRIETCKILEVKVDDKSETSCGIKVGDNIEKLKELYGLPHRSINLTSGSYLTFAQLSGGIMKGKEERDNDLVEFEISSNAEFPSNVKEVNFVENVQDGIIFKLDNENKVVHWAIYNKNVQTSDGSMD